MRLKWQLVSIAVLILAAGRSWALNSTLGPSTVPPSTLQNGLVRSVNPIDRTSDLVVTGNVTGGKQFRGPLPYNAVTDFGGPLQTGNVDSFLRYSNNPYGYQTYSGQMTPYYSPGRTVTTQSPGNRGMVRVGGSPDYSISDRYEPRLPVLNGPQLNTTYPLIVPRPLSMTTGEREQILSEDLSKLQPPKSILSTLNEQEQVNTVLLKDKLSALKQDLLAPDLTANTSQSILQVKEKQVPTEQPAVEKNKTDVFDQMKKQLENPLQPEEIPSTGTEEQIAPPATHGKETPEAKAGKESKAIGSPRINTTLVKYKSFAAYSADKFNQYMRLAEVYLKQGKFYWASDAYTLAATYKTDDPLAYAGKSHALLAAGEYVSSALYLSRAIKIYPDYAKVKIDLAGMLGGKDVLENRIADLTQWLEKNNNPDLYFLLAYIYYQSDQLEQAKKSIDLAAAGLPNVPAVTTLKTAIYGAAK